MSVRPSPLSLSAFSGPSPLLPQSLFSMYFSLYLSPSISLFSSFCLSLPFSFVVSVWRTLSLLSSSLVFLSFCLWLCFPVYIHVQLVSASLSLYFATSSPSMPLPCISALTEPASQSVSCPPLHASIYWLTCLSLLLFLSFSLSVISLCTFSLDIVRLTASLCLHFSFGIQVSGFLWLMLCVCLLSSARPCFSYFLLWESSIFHMASNMAISNSQPITQMTKDHYVEFNLLI